VAASQADTDRLRILYVSSEASAPPLPDPLPPDCRLDSLPIRALCETEMAAWAVGFDAVLFDLLDVDPEERIGSVCDTLSTLLHRDPLVKVVALVPAGDVATARAAVQEGTWDVLDSDSLECILPRLRAAARLSRLQREMPAAAEGEPALRPETGEPAGTEEEEEEEETLHMVGTSSSMRAIFSLIRRVATTDVPVLITGESGTGKELAATAIHERSLRCDGPFVVVNCGAIPENLLESELFGVERGAYTGATETRQGRAERAAGGTLFLDEVGELPPLLQVKLLRFLEDHVVERVGGSQRIPIDVRILAATNKDLPKETAKGRFREDLYFRLAVVTLPMPPLRERGEDVVLMARFFLGKYAREAGKTLEGFTPDAIDALLEARWPGNVRELINRVRRAVVLADGAEVTAADLGFDANRPRPAVPTLREARAHADVEAVRAALRRQNWNKVEAARALGISRTQLYEFMRRYEIPNHEYG